MTKMMGKAFSSRVEPITLPPARRGYLSVQLNGLQKMYDQVHNLKELPMVNERAQDLDSWRDRWWVVTPLF